MTKMSRSRGMMSSSFTRSVMACRGCTGKQIRSTTRENFDKWTDEERNNGAIPVFENSTANFGTVKAGTPVELTFNCSNRGKSTFHIYQADPEDPALKVLEIRDAEAGGKGFVRVQLNTSAVEKGETVIMLTLITNSPLRPVVNLFVAGQIL